MPSGARSAPSGDLPSESIVYPFINPQTGPFFVEGAEPGDTLAIHLIDVQPARDWAVSTTVPLFGALTGTKYTATLQPALPERTWLYAVDLAAREVIYQALDSAFSVRLPLEPFLGTIGVAPAADEARNVLVPEAFGGNMDTPEARAGTTIYLGVNVAGGALLDRRRALHDGRGRGLRRRRRRGHEHAPHGRGDQGRLLRVAAARGRRGDHGGRLVPAARGRVPHRPHAAHPMDLRRDRACR